MMNYEGCQKPVVAYFEVLSQHLPEATLEKKNKIPLNTSKPEIKPIFI
jgi:hypothetical protein